MLTGAAAASVGLYTWRVEPHWVEFVKLPLPIQHLPLDLVGKTLVQLSDIHAGLVVDDAYLIDTFRRVQALSPDIVVYTGDFVSYHPDVFRQAAYVYESPPRGRLATVGVLGNHDYGRNWAEPEVADRLAGIFADGGVTILRNESADVGGLQIVGLDDLWAARFAPEAPLRSLAKKRAAIVLSHNPDTVDSPVWGDYKSWIFSGHTHGGQCKAPFLPPPLLPVKNRRYAAGVFDLWDERTLYVSRGLGHLTRVRFNVRPEVTVFTLELA